MKTYTVTVDYNGTTRWYKEGTNQLHREDGPAVEWNDGARYWYINGEFHREDGPATELCNGTKSWYINGKRHREDGPAVECANGTKWWWINGECLTEDEFNNGTSNCDGRVVEIDGQKYKLTLAKD